MVAARTTRNRPYRRRRDWLRIPVVLGSWAVLAWIGLDVAAYLRDRYELTMRINRTLASADVARPWESVRALQDLTAQFARLRQTRPGRLLELARLPGLSVDRQLAVSCRNLGHFHSGRQESELAVRAYSLAWQYDSTLPDVAQPLMLECFARQNYELGLHAATRALAKGGQSAKTRDYFQRHLGE